MVAGKVQLKILRSAVSVNGAEAYVGAAIAGLGSSKWPRYMSKTRSRTGTSERFSRSSLRRRRRFLSSIRTIASSHHASAFSSIGWQSSSKEFMTPKPTDAPLCVPLEGSVDRRCRVDHNLYDASTGYASGALLMAACANDLSPAGRTNAGQRLDRPGSP